MPTRYVDKPPNPNRRPDEFNQYLVDKNEIVQYRGNWLIIENSFIKNQLVVFCLDNVRYFHELWEEDLVVLQNILRRYKDKHVYINADKDKSIPNRLHLHIKL
jgi:hypothetical protein